MAEKCEKRGWASLGASRRIPKPMIDVVISDDSCPNLAEQQGHKGSYNDVIHCLSPKKLITENPNESTKKTTRTNKQVQQCCRIRN